MYILPFVWMVATSLKTNSEMFGAISLFSSLVPETIQWKNYREIFTLIPFGRYLVNSFLTAMASALLETALAVLAAYGLCILKWKGREQVHRLLFMGWLIPFSAVLVPRFFLMVWLPDLLGGSEFWSGYRQLPFGGSTLAVGRLVGLDSFFALIVPGSVSITAAFLLVTAMERISHRLLDAAYLETGSVWRVFWDMVLPLVKPSLATVGFIAFLSSWQSFTWPLLITSTLDMQTATVGLRAFQNLHSTQWPLLMAGSVILTLPSLMFLLLAQIYIIDRYQISEFYNHRI
jgi:multiple sugar transport system permease protein